jgi:sulfoxide reductase catalytic subunit YedY
MLIRKRRGWEIPEREATPESVYLNRREVLGSMGVATVGLGGLLASTRSAQAQAPPGYPEAVSYPSGPAGDLYPPEPHPVLTEADAGRPVTPPEITHAYNNFYEFFTDKSQVWRRVGDFVTDPWVVEIGGEVERPGKYDLEELMRAMPMQERVCRLRCVEAWSAVIPWCGFPFRALIDHVGAKNRARYVAMTTVNRPDQMPGIPGQDWYPWPYFEALTIEEARNELAFLATGSYGKPQPKQNGAPIRLIVPWKFGFKNIKSIVKIEFVRDRPGTFWNELQPQEYGFWANINPAVPHPRWSQAAETFINTGERISTKKFNGYGEWVAELYTDLEEEYGPQLYR